MDVSSVSPPQAIKLNDSSFRKSAKSLEQSLGGRMKGTDIVLQDLTARLLVANRFCPLSQDWNDDSRVDSLSEVLTISEAAYQDNQLKSSIAEQDRCQAYNSMELLRHQQYHPKVTLLPRQQTCSCSPRPAQLISIDGPFTRTSHGYLRRWNSRAMSTTLIRLRCTSADWSRAWRRRKLC